MRKDILLCGVGGQGTVLASRLIAAAAMRNGVPVMSAETIGMAQKGGSVASHLRLGAGVFSPMLPRGAAELLIAFEPSEAVRMLPYLKAGGTVVVNTQPVVPVSALLQGQGYDAADMLAYLRRNSGAVVAVDCRKACAELGSGRVMNMLLLGAAAGCGALGLTSEDLKAALRENGKPQFYELNCKALDHPLFDPARERSAL